MPPLATLRGASELALEDDIDPAQRRDLLTMISRQVNRLDRLVQDLADIFRLQSGQLQLNRAPVDLHALCEEVIADQYQPEYDHFITPVISEGLPAVPADRLKLRAVLGNIIGNAVKYSPPGTAILVSAGMVGNEINIAVQDEGPGISPEHLPHIFDQFYRAQPTQARAKGYGLGLYIARTLIELHGGTIQVTSELGRGTRFILTLPLDTEAQEQFALEAPAAPGNAMAESQTRSISA